MNEGYVSCYSNASPGISLVKANLTQGFSARLKPNNIKAKDTIFPPTFSNFASKIKSFPPLKDFPSQLMNFSPKFKNPATPFVGEGQISVKKACLTGLLNIRNEECSYSKRHV